MFYWMQGLRILRVRQFGVERLRRQSLLVVSNHQSLLDTPLLIACIPYADCYIKAQHRRYPWLAAPAFGAGFLHADAGIEIIQKSLDSLEKKQNSLIIFPEGTRQKKQVMAQRWQRGAAHIALRANKNITPVCIRWRPAFLSRAQKWYDVPSYPIEVDIRVEQDFPIVTYQGQPYAIGARRLTDDLVRYYQRMQM